MSRVFSTCAIWKSRLQSAAPSLSPVHGASPRSTASLAPCVLARTYWKSRLRCAEPLEILLEAAPQGLPLCLRQQGGVNGVEREPLDGIEVPIPGALP